MPRAAMPPPGAIFIVDCTPLVPAGGIARDVVDKEVSDARASDEVCLGKQINRPVSRILDRLCAGYRGRTTLVGVEAGAPLALSLLEYGATLGAARRSGAAVERVVLPRPYLSAAANALLVRPACAPPLLDVHCESAKDIQRREVAVRHAFPKGDSCVLDPHVAMSGALYSALLSHGASCVGPSPADVRPALDPDAIDSAGRAVFGEKYVWLQRIHVEIIIASHLFILGFFGCVLTELLSKVNLFLCRQCRQ